MSLPFVIVLYALIRDDAAGVRAGDERTGGTEQFGDVSEVDISCLHVPFALDFAGAGTGGN